MKTSAERALGIIVSLCLTASVVLAQEKRPMTFIDLLELPNLSDPQLSPDGRQLAYLVGKADWKANKRIEHIWRVESDGTGAIQLTSGEEGESSPRWSPDGKWIAFLAKRGESKETQIYLLSNSGGEAEPLTQHETSVSSPAWSPDGSALYFLAPDPKSSEEKEKDKAKDDVYAFDQNFKQRHLWRMGIADRTEKKITEGEYSVLSYRLSRDGKKMTFHRAPSPLIDDEKYGEVWVMDADGRGALQLTRNGVGESGAELSPDNSQVLFTSDTNEKFEPYFNGNIFLVPANGGPARLLIPDLPYEANQASWSKEGDAIFFVANTGVRSELFRATIASRKAQPITKGDHAVGAWRLSPTAGQHVLTIDEPTNSGDVWMLPASGQGAPRQVTHVFDYLSKDFKLPRQEAIQWKGADGVTVEGLLYYPLDYQQGRAYPLVVQTHGGPAASDKFGFGRWSSYTQVLAAKGYAVLKPNYRGSTGYGNDFLRDMVGHYFKNAHLDVMSGVDDLISRGIADPNSLVKMGWSGGGHMTNKMITFTDRFKAASSGAGAANWISMYAQSDVRTYRTPWFGGTPWQENAPIDLYWEHSPLKYIHKVKTPTIILVGENDVRVPPPQSVELYRALKANVVPTHLYLAPREPHGWQELRHELFKMNVELDWFEKNALGRAYTWEKAPAEPEKKEEAKPTTQPLQ